MPSSSKTEKLRLNQWQRSDFISMDDFNADNAAVEAAVASLPLTKLFDHTLTAEAASVPVDLTQFDLTDVMRLEVYVLGNGYGKSTLRVNNIDTVIYTALTHTGNWSPSSPYYFDMTGNYGTIHLRYADRIYYNGANHTYQYLQLAPAALNSLTFYNQDNNPFPAGTRCVVYAFRP